MQVLIYNRAIMLSKKTKILTIIAALILVFVILEFGYIEANIKFLFFRPPSSEEQSSSGQTQNKAQPNMLIIDSLGIKVPIVYVDQNSEKAYQAGLINGVVHYPGTANPGQLGNCYIFGHSSDFLWSKGRYKSIFAVLPLIKKGAEILISDQKGNQFTYIVTDSRKVGVNDLSVLDQQGYKKKLLTLQTSYPVGTALARWIVVGEIK